MTSPHSFSLDPHSKSTALDTIFLSSTTPSQISTALSAVESHLSSHSPDQNRHFFSLAFPTFLCKLFGFDVSSTTTTSTSSKPPSSSGWLDTVSSSNDTSELSGKIYSLLSPNGILINSIMAVDRLSLVKFVFPVERLPEWIRLLFLNEKGCRVLSEICNLFKGRVKEDEIKGNFQIHLNVFEYYMFWFAYYPVCRGNYENCGDVSVRRKSKIENWTSVISRGGGGGGGGEVRRNFDLYLKVLYGYLCVFVPMNDLSSEKRIYRSSLLNYSSSFDDSVVLRAEFLVEMFVNYWLVDSDFSPLGVNVCKSFGLSFSFRSVLRETPPGSGLGEVVKLLVNYLNLSSIVVNDGVKEGSSLYKSFGSSDVKSREALYVSTSLPSSGSWNSFIQRPLYRFVLRTYLNCPMGASMKNISDVVSVWVAYIEPWKLSKEDFVEFDVMTEGTKNVSEKDSSDANRKQYSNNWQGYVLSNYLFYTSLVMHFIGFAHKFLHTDAEAIVQMISRVYLLTLSFKYLLQLKITALAILVLLCHFMDFSNIIMKSVVKSVPQA